MNKLKGFIEIKEGEIGGIASTESTDRDGEIIKQAGWDFGNFNSNPVLMLMHNYQDFPIGKVTELKVVDGKLLFKAIFSKTLPKAKEAYELVKEGILNCLSVGFIPREFDTKDQNVITKAELLEISLVPVPANPQAVILAKSFQKNDIASYIVKNFDLEEKTIDEDVLQQTADAIKEAEEKKEEETIPEKGEDSTTEVPADKVGEDSAKAIDIDLKVIQQATGILQTLCRELKQKGGEKK